MVEKLNRTKTKGHVRVKKLVSNLFEKLCLLDRHEKTNN